MAIDRIALDSEYGLVLIPPGDPQYVIGFSIWDDSLEAFRTFVRRSLADTERILVEPDGSAALPIVVSLVPRPDNQYNSDAISVASPPAYGGDIFDRHMGYMYDKHLSIRGAPLQVLSASEDEPIGCHGSIELGDVGWWHDEYIKESSVVDRGNPFSAQEQKELGFSIGSIRLNLPYWKDLREMVGARVRARQPHHVLPFTGHRAAWLSGARDKLSGLGVVNPFMLDLRVDEGVLYAWYGDLALSKLSPGARDFFDRTLIQVQGLGGHATAQAEFHGGSLTVFVEDSDPIE